MKKEKLTQKMKTFIEALRREYSWLEEEGFTSAPIRTLQLSDKERDYFRKIKNRPEIIDKIDRKLFEKYDLSINKDHTDFGTSHAKYEWWLCG